MGRVGFIGLGNMGGRMAARLRGAGYEVLGYDVRREARSVDSVADACSAEAIFLSLPDSRAVEEVVLGEDGVRDSARAGTVVIDTTTAEPTSTRKLHSTLADRRIDLLDAGISGGPIPAERGALTLMVGGSEQALERVRPLLDVVGDRISYLGSSGSGHTAKAVNNYLNGVNLAAAAEAMIVGTKAGLDPARLVDVINASSGRNWATEVRIPRVLSGDYQEGSLTTKLMAKDLEIYLALARSLGASTEVAEACRRAFQVVEDHGQGDEVSNRIIDVLGDLAGGIRLQREPPG